MYPVMFVKSVFESDVLERIVKDATDYGGKVSWTPDESVLLIVFQDEKKGRDFHETTTKYRMNIR